MFIERLWEENPELLIKAIKKICNIDEDLAKAISFDGVDKNGNLKFSAQYSVDYCKVYLNDFYIQGEEYEERGLTRHTRMIFDSSNWMKFMYNVYGDKYAMQYISKRNQKLDKFMADYEEKYNNETRKMLSEMGFEAIKGQTK